MTHTVKGFSTVNEAEVDVFLELYYFFYDPTDVGKLTSGNVMGTTSYNNPDLKNNSEVH